MSLDVPTMKFTQKMKSHYTGPPKPEREAMAMFEYLVLYIRIYFYLFKEKGWLLISALENHIWHTSVTQLQAESSQPFWMQSF